MSENGWREISDAGRRDALGRLSRAGSWWLALAVVCTVGLVAVGVLAFAGRPNPGPDPAAGPAAAAGSHRGTRGAAGAPATTPAGGVSPSAVPAGPITSPAPAAAPRPSPPRPAPSPQPSPSPVASPPAFVTLNPASGPATLTPTPTWSASACPSGYQGSARLSEYTLAGTFISTISNVVGTVASPFSGQLLGTVGALLNFGGVTTPPGTLRWTVSCYSGTVGTGSQIPAGSVYVTLSADGSSYTSSATAG